MFKPIKNFIHKGVNPKISKKDVGVEYSTIKSSYFEDYSFILDGYNPNDLFIKKNLDIVDKIRKDEQYKAAMGTKKHAILAKGWDIHPASEDKLHKEQADFVKTNFTNWMVGSFNNNLLDLLTFLDYGFVVAEQNYEFIDNSIILKNIKIRAPHSFKIMPDEFGNLTDESLIQQTDEGDIALPIDKMVLYSYRKEFDNWFGKPDTIDIYRSWFIKDILIKMQSIYLEKYGTPSIIVKYEGKKLSERNKLMKMFQKFRSASVGVIPKDVEYEIIEAVNGGGLAFKQAIQYHDNAISKGILMPNEMGFNQSDSGSNAKSRTQFDVFLWTVQSIRDTFEEAVVNEQIIRPLINYNWGEQDEYPKFKFNPVTEKDKVSLFDIWVKALDAGAVLATEEDEEFIRKTVEFPERTEKSTLLVKPLTPQEEANNKMKEDSLKQKAIDDKEAKENEDKNPNNDVDKEDKNDKQDFQLTHVHKLPDGGLTGKAVVADGGHYHALKDGKTSVSSDNANHTHKLPDGKKTSVPVSIVKFQANNDFPVTAGMERIDFNKIENIIDTAEDKLFNDVDDIVEKISIEAIDRIDNKNIISKKRFDEIDKFQLKHVGELKLAYKKGFRKMYVEGVNSFKDELPKVELRRDNELMPDEFKVWLNSQAFMEAGKMADAYKTMVKQTLLISLENGWSGKKTFEQLEQQFARIKVAGATAKPVFTEGRLKTIVRTNLSTSFNKGRYLQSLELSEESNLPIYRLFSEVLSGHDTDSHPWSKKIHGKYVKQGTELSQRLQYPMHFNERGIDTVAIGGVDEIPQDQILTSMPDLSSFSGMLIS